jgi:DNA-binding CsgD family transcriptional regulator
VNAYLERRGSDGIGLVPLSDDAADTSVGIGRDPSNLIAVPVDPELSRTHALLVRIPSGWCLRDLSSRNGTFVNNERVASDRPLHDGDEIRVGRTRLVFRQTVGVSDAGPTTTATRAPELTRREREVLIALVAPTRKGDLVSEPASTRDIAGALFVSEAAVKQHLAHLYDKFAIFEGDRRRVRLANEALRRGAVTVADFLPPNS